MLHPQVGDVLTTPTLQFIHHRARQLAGCLGLSTADRDDLAQELTRYLLRQLPSYSSERGELHTFVKTVIERCATSLIRKNLAQRRARKRECSVHDMVEDEGGNRHELGDSFTEDVHCRRLRTTWRSDHEQVELKHDIDAVMAQLPAPLRALASRLQFQSKAEAARDLGIPRTTLNDACRRLREYLEAAGLGDPSPPASEEGPRGVRLKRKKGPSMNRKTNGFLCCTSCGRDTRSSDGICERCRSTKNCRDEQIGRAARPPAVLAGHPFDENEDEQETATTAYHGPTIRDDI